MERYIIMRHKILFILFLLKLTLIIVQNKKEKISNMNFFTIFPLMAALCKLLKKYYYDY